MTDTPNPLKGNPHYDLAYDRVVAAAATSEAGDEQVAQTEALMAQTEATLALAFEVRTQTLTSTHQHAQRLWVERRMDALDAGSEEEFLKRMDELTHQINSRLGLEN